MQKKISSAKIEEYKYLKSETLKRIEFRYKSINLILIAAGTFISIGSQQKSALILLIYPVISLFLTFSWVHNGISLTRIGQYIREEIEDDKNLRWEGYLKGKEENATAFSNLNTLGSIGLVVSTQILSYILALTIHMQTTSQEFVFTRAVEIFLGFDFVVIVITLIILIMYLRRRRI